MNENKLMNQVTAIFGLFMVVFYLGVGIYLIFFFNRTYMDRAVLVIVGTSFIFYGIYRAFRSFTRIKELFFGTGKEEDDEDSWKT